MLGVGWASLRCSAEQHHRSSSRSFPYLRSRLWKFPTLLFPTGRLLPTPQVSLLACLSHQTGVRKGYRFPTICRSKTRFGKPSGCQKRGFKSQSMTIFEPSQVSLSSFGDPLVRFTSVLSCRIEGKEGVEGRT